MFTKNYRRNYFVQKDTDEIDSNDTLIHISNFKAFLPLAYDRFNSHVSQESLRQALYQINNVPKVISGSTFVSLYSAIETLMYEFRERQNFELAVPDQETWKLLKKKLKKSVCSVLKENEELIAATRREYVYQKLDELNRIGFSTVLREFCHSYSVDLTDLWPLTGQALTLSDIRNKLVHGYRFGHNEVPMLMCAHENLRWTAERMILGILGWPITKSCADSGFLAYNNLYKSWKSDQVALTASMATPPHDD